MTEIYIPLEKTFDLPAGRYRATLVQVKSQPRQTRTGMQEWVRVLFRAQIPSLCHYEAMAGRNFPASLDPGSDLRNFIQPVLSTDFFRQHAGQKITLKMLEGLECDIKLVHQHSDDYDRPLVVVAEIAPAGSMKLKEQPVQPEQK